MTRRDLQAYDLEKVGGSCGRLTKKDKLKAKADVAEADAQIEYNKKIEELRSMQKGASDKFDELKKASDDSWEDLKRGIDGAWDSLSGAIKWASSRLN